jgi:hypothetical protein
VSSESGRIFFFFGENMKGLDTLAKLYTVRPKVNYLPCFISKGIQFVCRYLRNLDAVEVKAICDAGLQIVSIAERGNPTSRRYFTNGAGLKDGNWAVQRASVIGQPEGTGIYFTVDFGTVKDDLPAITEYFKGVNQALAGTGYLVGGYGPGMVLAHLVSNNLIAFSWLANAHSWRPGFKNPNIDQGAETTLCGCGIDPDEARDDFGAWTLGSVVASVPTARAPVATTQAAPSVVASAQTPYTVKAGDSLSVIAKAHGISLDALLSANKIVVTHVIHPGDKLTLPA